ncbi:hypothetical protein [Streptomyces sp. NPDC087300]|uniref:hypothetical protein n=1 Tax=Streptomyces sp. NPDC087300 TaxID=3365780 RepID=UPI0037F3A949
MSRTAPSAPARRHAPWPRALLILVLPLLVLLAPAHASPAPPPPAVTLTTESGPENQQDATVTALRLPTHHATRLPTPPSRPHRGPLSPETAPAPPRQPHPHVPAPRSVILRC